MTSRGLVAAGAALCGLAGALPVAAQSSLLEWQQSPGPGLAAGRLELPSWQAAPGPALLVRPELPGPDLAASGRFRLQPDTLLQNRQRARPFLSTGDVIGTSLIGEKGYRAGIALSYDRGREADETGRFRGMGEVKPTPEVKFFADVAAFPMVVRAAVKKGVGGHKGVVGDLGAYLPLASRNDLSLFVGPAMTFASGRYMRNYYGIGAGQAERSGRQRFDAKGGLRSVGLGANMAWKISDQWRLQGSAAAERLLGSAAASPLTGQPVNLALTLKVNYRF